jgi:uncharacterized protein (TIGR02246 family)
MEADRAFAAAAAARGLDGWMDAFAPDAVRLVMGRSFVRGLDAIRAADADLFADPAVHLTWAPADAGVFDDGRTGFTTGLSAYVRLGGGAPDTLGTGRYVTLWRLGDDGRWRVILDTGSYTPRP